MYDEDYDDEYTHELSYVQEEVRDFTELFDVFYNLISQNDPAWPLVYAQLKKMCDFAGIQFNVEKLK